MEISKSVQLPGPLFDSLKLQLQHSSFKSVDDYVVFILQNYLDQQQNDVDMNQQSKDDIEVLKRLEDLGYM